MYRDFAGEKVLAASQYEKEREYWVNKLSGELVKASFPPDYTTPEPTGHQATVDFRFPGELFNLLMKIINNSYSRLHMALVTGLTILLFKYTGQTDILIATPIDKQEEEGEFINTLLPLRNQIREQMTVKELLMQVRQTVIESSQHQNYPMEMILYDLDIPGGEEDFPLFDTAILLRNIQDRQYIRHINFSMVFSFLMTDRYLEGTVEYDASIFEKETITRIIDHFLLLMQEAFSHVETRVVELPLLTEREKKQLVIDFNHTDADYPRNKTIHRLFEEQVKKTPANIAAEAKEEKLTYKALNEKANRLAGLLRERGIDANTVAAIMLESSIQVPIAVMAVLKAGGIYLPMGFEYPGERIGYLLKDSQAKILLSKKTLLKEMTIAYPIIDLQEETLYTGNGENLQSIDGSESPAYIIYTSGTAGHPKGVIIKHQGLVNYIWWAAQTYVKDEIINFPLYTSISYDLTVTSIFTPLITGGAILVYGGIDKKLYIEDVIDDNRVGVVKMTPSHLKLIRQKKVKDSRIKRLIVGGENLETQLAIDIYHNFADNLEIYNEYGPTETVVGSMIYKFDPIVDNRHWVPIGVPIANTRIYLLNSHLQPVPVGVEGEIYIAGDGLAEGYLHNEQLTIEKFVANPFSPGERMYRTGDLAIRLPNGNIQFKGRRDHQVKIRGYRVEIGEIETKIVDFQRMRHTQQKQKENILEKLDLKSVTTCKRCLIPVNYPGGIHFNEEGVCDICREFETYKDKALKYFRTVADFDKVLERAQKTKKSQYDCLMLYSGGKDSSFVLHHLVERGLKVLAFTFDNGYISKTCWANIARTISLLKVDHIVMKSEAMREIFVDSLYSDYNVCNGCFKAVNTLGTKLAHEHNINLVVSGLTRGQIFDIKLYGLFKLGIFDEEEVDERLKLFRQNYHAMTHRTSRLIGVEITYEMLDNIYFVDYFRYDDISTSEIFEYLKQRDPEWIRPSDTGASSSNCIINDVGIYVHFKDKGCHFYAAQSSWDCRLGTITREEGIEELIGFKVDYPGTQQVLNEIGYYDAFSGAAVTDIKDERGENTLCAYIVADKEFDSSELRDYLASELPNYMIPTYFTKIDRIPLTSSGKVDRKALPKPELTVEEKYSAPRNAIEKRLVKIWSELLGIKEESIGIDSNFFEIGGHSLRATFLAAATQKEFNADLPLVKIFEAPTIRNLAIYIETAVKKTFAGIPPAGEKDHYALSSAQSRSYILQQMDLTSTTYNVNIVVELKGPVDKKKLEFAFIGLIDRHENLRTSFQVIDGIPRQKIDKLHEIEFKIQYILEGGEQCADRQQKMEKLIKQFIRPFDLTQAPLLRVGLVELEPSAYILMVDMPHIITDGISHGILISDFISLYNGNYLPALPLQYKDYAEWQQSKEVKETLTQQENYWLRAFSGEIPVLNLPCDYPRPAVQSFAGNHVVFGLTPEETTALKKLAHSREATLFMVLLSVYYIFLSKVSNQEDIVVGTPIAGRGHAGLEKIIGLFVNTLALRNRIPGEKSFIRFIADVKKQCMEAFENQDYPFENIVEKAAVERDISRNPLFDAIIILQNMFDPSGVVSESTMEDIVVIPYAYEVKTAMVDLTLNCIERGEQLFIRIEYCTHLFKEQTSKRFIQYLKKVISTIIEDPDQQISRLEIITEEEKEQILCDFNDTGLEYPKDRTVHELFSAQIEKGSDNIAVIGVVHNPSLNSHQPPLAAEETKSIGALTYHNLNEISNRLASYLTLKGLGPGKIAGIMVERLLEMMVAVLAVLKTGAAYLPMDSTYPAERLNYMLADSDTSIVLTSRAFKNIITCPAEIVEIEDTSLYTGDHNFNHPVNSHELAYVIYTSGSTGKPKGVLIPHRAVVNFIKGITSIIAFERRDTILSLTTISFDIFVLETILPLTRGARVVMGTRTEQMNAETAARLMSRENVTIMQFTPSRLSMLISEQEAVDCLKRLKSLLVGGEAFPGDLLEKTREITGCNIYNVYGPTETTIWSTIKNVSKGNSLNIGKPIANTRIYILSKDRNLQPCAIPGELFIAGDGLARGYINKPELTWKRFTTNPYSNPICQYRSPLLYRTGDIARWLASGDIEFIGREDHQVKIRGFRIELAEIETFLSRYPGIKETVVISRAIADGDKHLCAYMVKQGADEQVPMDSQLKEYLSRILPDYMIPTFFIWLEKISLTPNGKIDRKALPLPRLQIGKGTDYTSPRNEIERELVGIWAQELGLAPGIISIDANFFLLGGQSLKAIILMSKIHKKMNVKVPLVELFKKPTIRGLAGYIKEAAREKFISIKPVEKKDYYALSSAQKRIYIEQQLQPETTAYNFSYTTPLAMEIDKVKLEKAFGLLMARHESLRTSFQLVESKPVQRVYDTGVLLTVECDEYNKQGKENADSVNQWVSKKMQDFSKPFDLAKAPLLRVLMLKLDNNMNLCVVNLHHIITDATSMEVLKRDFMVLLVGEELPGLKIRYKDFSVWQNGLFKSSTAKDLEKYWLQRLSGYKTGATIPIDFPRPPVRNFEGDFITFKVGKELATGIKQLMARDGMTLYMVLLAAYNILLFKYTGNEDIVVGTAVSGRNHADLEGVVGMFINMIITRNQPRKDKTFNSFLAEIKNNALQDFENQDYPFEELVKKALKQGDEKRFLFDTVFQVQNVKNQPVEMEEPTKGNEIRKPNLAHFDLVVTAFEYPEAIDLVFNYSSEIFKPSTVEKMGQRLESILKQVVEKPGIKLEDIVVSYNLLSASVNIPGNAREDFAF